jgi:hypothetical protein
MPTKSYRDDDDVQFSPKFQLTYSIHDGNRMIRRRAADAGIETKICCYPFRATGITEYLRNGGKLEWRSRCEPPERPHHGPLRPPQRPGQPR